MLGSAGRFVNLTELMQSCCDSYLLSLFHGCTSLEVLFIREERSIDDEEDVKEPFILHHFPQEWSRLKEIMSM